jgi:hypothetical protein
MTSKTLSLRTAALAALTLVAVAACNREAPAPTVATPAKPGPAAAPAKAAKPISTTPAPEGMPSGPVRFGDYAMLRKVEMACASDGLHIRMDWSPMPGNKGQRMNNAVHLLDADNKLVVNLDFPAKPWPAGSKLESMRAEHIRVPAVTQGNAVKLALGVYDPATATPLQVDRGNGIAPPARVIMPLKACPAQ